MADVLKKMRMAKVFHDNEACVNAMDFSADGELLVTSSDDETLHLYSAQTATMKKTVFSKKYGIDLVRFTHQSNSVLCASKNNWDESIRYLSLHDNSYLRYFKGHRDRVVSLCISPLSDSFVSGSLDGTCRMWDLRAQQCQGLIRLNIGRTIAAFDPSGLVLCVVGSGNLGLKLYDVKNYENGPFVKANIPLVNPNNNNNFYEFSSVQFSNDGKYILLSTLENSIFLLDAYLPPGKPHLLRQITSFKNDTSLLLQPTFTPDSKFIISGSEDGTIHGWSTETGEEISCWKGHAGPVGIVCWNPKYLMAASACTNVAFWIPSSQEQIIQPPQQTMDISNN